MKPGRIAMFLAPASLLLASPALAGWTLMPQTAPAATAKSVLTVTPAGEWNRSSRRPSVKGEVWTQHGLNLDTLTFYGGIAKGEPLVKERQKKEKPLPKFDSAMLPTDIPQLYEQTQRISLSSSLFEIMEVRPVQFAGNPGVQFSFRFTVENDNLERRGEARAAVVGGKLYMIEYAAPTIHYFDAGIENARRIMDSARI